MKLSLKGWVGVFWLTDITGALIPLDQAILQLKNSAGVIDQKVPITSCINDPQFRFGSLISQAIPSCLTV